MVFFSEHDTHTKPKRQASPVVITLDSDESSDSTVVEVELENDDTLIQSDSDAESNDWGFDTDFSKVFLHFTGPFKINMNPFQIFSYRLDYRLASRAKQID